MCDQSRCPRAGDEERYDDEKALLDCRVCLRRLPLRMLDSDGACANRFACWIAAEDLSEHLDVHGLV